MVFNGYDLGEIGSERLIVFNKKVLYNKNTFFKNTITDLGHCSSSIE